MPIGAYDPGFAYTAIQTSWEMANDAGANYILPVHHKTFQLSREPAGEPIERILTVAGNDAERICLQEIGQEFHA